MRDALERLRALAEKAIEVGAVRSPPPTPSFFGFGYTPEQAKALHAVERAANPEVVAALVAVAEAAEKYRETAHAKGAMRRAGARQELFDALTALRGVLEKS